MDKLMFNKSAVKEIVEYIASISPSDSQVETQLIEDEIRGHYLLYSVGWENNQHREYTAFVHIDVKPNGKVYIQHDGTDLNIAYMLVEKGVPKSDIVLAFKAPFYRKHIRDFAEA
jgi:hypothetical protein